LDYYRSRVPTPVLGRGSSGTGGPQGLRERSASAPPRLVLSTTSVFHWEYVRRSLLGDRDITPCPHAVSLLSSDAATTQLRAWEERATPGVPDEPGPSLGPLPICVKGVPATPLAWPPSGLPQWHPWVTMSLSWPRASNVWTTIGSTMTARAQSQLALESFGGNSRPNTGNLSGRGVRCFSYRNPSM
jgi:hypothetical protein